MMFEMRRPLGPSYRADAGFPVSRPAEPEVALPIAVSISAALMSANPKAGDKRFPVDNLSSLNLSAKTDGVQWAGETDLMSQNEKSAFVSQLVTLGYSPHEFRGAVRRVPPEGHDDTKERYTVLVIQLRNGALYRERRYFG